MNIYFLASHIQSSEPGLQVKGMHFFIYYSHFPAKNSSKKKFKKKNSELWRIWQVFGLKQIHVNSRIKDDS